MSTKVTAMPGEVWAYRASKLSELMPKLVIEIERGTRRKALITSPDDLGAGEWVPLLRLKVVWSEVEQFLRNEASWENISTVDLRERPAEHALMTAFNILIDARIAEPTFREDGITIIHDVAALAAFLDLPAEALLTDGSSFCDGPDLVVPWPITLLIVTSACRRYPGEILAECDVWEAKRGRTSRYGSMFTQSDQIAIDKEIAPSYELLRAWASRDASRDRGRSEERLTELSERLAELTRSVEALVELASERPSPLGSDAG